MANAIAPLLCQLFYTALPGTEPITNKTCDELPPDCLGGHIPTSLHRCRAAWSVQIKSHIYYEGGGEWHGDWTYAIGGGYTQSGQAYITGMPSCGGVPYYWCAAYGPGDPCEFVGGCHSYQVLEVQLTRAYPEPTPEGETCC